MSDKTILHHIDELVAEEQKLRAEGAVTADQTARLKHVADQLDQCWDLLRQRRAKSEFGDDPSTAAVRDVGTVKSYVG